MLTMQITWDAPGVILTIAPPLINPSIMTTVVQQNHLFSYFTLEEFFQFMQINKLWHDFFKKNAQQCLFMFPFTEKIYAIFTHNITEEQSKNTLFIDWPTGDYFSYSVRGRNLCHPRINLLKPNGLPTEVTEHAFKSQIANYILQQEKELFQEDKRLIIKKALRKHPNVFSLLLIARVFAHWSHVNTTRDPIVSLKKKRFLHDDAPQAVNYFVTRDKTLRKRLPLGQQYATSKLQPLLGFSYDGQTASKIYFNCLIIGLYLALWFVVGIPALPLYGIIALSAFIIGSTLFFFIATLQTLAMFVEIIFRAIGCFNFVPNTRTTKSQGDAYLRMCNQMLRIPDNPLTAAEKQDLQCEFEAVKKNMLIALHSSLHTLAIGGQMDIYLDAIARLQQVKTPYELALYEEKATIRAVLIEKWAMLRLEGHRIPIFSFFRRTGRTEHKMMAIYETLCTLDSVKSFAALERSYDELLANNILMAKRDFLSVGCCDTYERVSKVVHGKAQTFFDRNVENPNHCNPITTPSAPSLDSQSPLQGMP